MTIEQVNRYANKTIEIIYCSSDGELTKRRVKVQGITKKQFFGYCYLRNQRRSFLVENVLAWQPTTNWY
ncbi:hypothetical protein [Aquibacillus kalidii]|uniref:hypothetical protein n=1 Tax=Aquibacillus kalidii TaxID=2762597 RepID=UPI001645A0F6|nr:hypothetical protein [Aquibacillus kalidii]